MAKFWIPALLVLTLALAACSGDGALRETAAVKGYTVNARSDTPLAADRCRMRFFVEGTELTQAEWKIDGQTYNSTAADGSVFVDFDHASSVNASFRGVDKDGKDCTGPRGGVKFSARKGANAEPVLIVDGPESLKEGTETSSDGTTLRYHQWRWTSARSYDPDFDNPFTSYDWELWSEDSAGNPLTLLAHKTDCIAYNGDWDGDGVDDLIVDSNPDATQFMVTAYFIRESPTRMTLKVKPKDTKGEGKKEYTGHVSLLK